MTVKTTEISATSRASVKILVHGKEQYFTVEYSEKRTVEYGKGEHTDDELLDEARKNLWDTCNAEVDNQLQEIENTFKK